MTPRRRRPAPPAPPSKPARTELHPVLVGVIVMIAVVAGVWLMRANRGATGRVTSASGALAESLRVADARKDWVATLRFAEALGRQAPREPAVLLARSKAWNNYAIARRPVQSVDRPALRTSLERIDGLRRSMVLADSSAMAAGNGAGWIEGMRQLARVEEWMGLPGDALIMQEAIKQRVPDDVEAGMRVYFLRAFLYDPTHPDTSAWHARMRELGLR